MHADAANVGYGGTLGSDLTAGTPSLWEAQGFWSSTDSQQSNNASRTSSSAPVTRPVFCQIRIRLPSSSTLGSRGQPGCASYAQRYGVGQSGNDGRVAQIAQTITRLEYTDPRIVDTIGGEKVRGRPIPNIGPRRHSSIAEIVAVNMRTVSVGRALVYPTTIARAVAGQVTRHPSPARTTVERRSVTALEPALRLLTISGEEDRTRGRDRDTSRPSLDNSVLVRAITATLTPHRYTRRPCGNSYARDEHQPALAHGRRSNIQREWARGIRQAVLGVDGHATTTGGAEEAAHLLSELGWSKATWSTRASQVAKWLRFCDEDMRSPLPANEGDVLAYIGYLSIEGSVSPESLPQYVSAVSRFHELHYLTLPTRAQLVRSLVRAYHRQYDLRFSRPKSVRVGVPAGVMRKIVSAGMAATLDLDIACCAMVTMSFVFGVRSVSMQHVECKDLVFETQQLTATFAVRKDRSVRRPLVLRYPVAESWGAINPIALMRRWYGAQDKADATFPMSYRTVYNDAWPCPPLSRQKAATTLQKARASGRTTSYWCLDSPTNGL